MLLRVRALSLAFLVGVLFLGAGCSGINASGSVSPATFLLPGLGQTAPAKAPVATPEPVSDAPVFLARSQ